VRTCKGCGIEGGADVFYVNPKGKFGLDSKCKQCRSASEKAIVRRRGLSARLLPDMDPARMGTAGRRDYLRRYKLSRGCTDCGYKDHYAALELDHLPEFEKGFEISQAVWKLSIYSDEEFLAEFAKCEVVCANCHRIRTTSRLPGSKKALENEEGAA